MFVKDTWTAPKVNILCTYNYPIIMMTIVSTETPVIIYNSIRPLLQSLVALKASGNWSSVLHSDYCLSH
jgi:hypothetical protein